MLSAWQFDIARDADPDPSHPSSSTSPYFGLSNQGSDVSAIATTVIDEIVFVLNQPDYEDYVVTHEIGHIGGALDNGGLLMSYQLVAKFPDVAIKRFRENARYGQ